jgi:hypothetical protein
MSSSTDPRRRLRMFGGIWVALAPLLFLMAAISTVRSETTYYIQLAGFSIVALGGLVAGVGALFRCAWAGRFLLVLSWLGAAYFIGSALMLLLWPFFPDTAAKLNVVILLISLGIALTGMPFVLMARSLRRILKDISRSSEMA